MKTQHAVLAFGIAILFPGCSASTPETPANTQPLPQAPTASRNIQPAVSAPLPTPSPPSQSNIDRENYNGNYSGASSSSSSRTPTPTYTNNTPPAPYNSQTSPPINAANDNNANQQSLRDSQAHTDFNNRIQADNERERAMQEEDRSRQAGLQQDFDNKVRQDKLRGLQDEREDVINSNKTESTKKLNLDSINDRQRRMMSNP